MCAQLDNSVTLSGLGLTRREREVFWLVAERLHNREIAERLHIGIRTVESHVSTILRKLGLDHRDGIVALAARTARRQISGAAPPAPLSSFVGLHEVAAYVASKSAVAGLTRALAVEWAPHGVNVNAIAPGVFRTDLNTALLDAPRGQEFKMRTPMKRFGQIEELVGAAIFLAADASAFVTGHVLAVDGGFLASGVNQ